MAQVRLIDYWANWCTPCKIMAPILEEIRKERPNLLVEEINIDEKPEVAQKDNVLGIPTYIVIKDDIEVGRKVGITPKTELLKLIDS